MRNLVFLLLLLAVLPFWIAGMAFFLVKTGFENGMVAAGKVVDWSKE